MHACRSRRTTFADASRQDRGETPLSRGGVEGGHEFQSWERSHRDHRQLSQARLRSAGARPGQVARARPIIAAFVGSVAERGTRGTQRTRRAGRQAQASALERLAGSRVIRLVGSRRTQAHNWSAQARHVYRQATYTLAPYGDTPESARIYQALAAGSVPIVDQDFQRPRFASWANFSLTIQSACTCQCACANATWRLPERARQLALHRGAFLHARTFACEPSNAAFTAYVTRGLLKLVECEPLQRRRAPDKATAKRLGCTFYQFTRKQCMRGNYSLPGCERWGRV